MSTKEMNERLLLNDINCCSALLGNCWLDFCTYCFSYNNQLQ